MRAVAQEKQEQKPVRPHGVAHLGSCDAGKRQAEDYEPQLVEKRERAAALECEPALDEAAEQVAGKGAEGEEERDQYPLFEGKTEGGKVEEADYRACKGAGQDASDEPFPALAVAEDALPVDKLQAAVKRGPFGNPRLAVNRVEVDRGAVGDEGGE